MKTFINQPINVTGFRFNKQFDTVPSRIEFQGRTLHFLDAGIRYLIKHNGHITQLFDMSDGEASYRLRHENTAWTLVAISQ